MSVTGSLRLGFLEAELKKEILVSDLLIQSSSKENEESRKRQRKKLGKAVVSKEV